MKQISIIGAITIALSVSACTTPTDHAVGGAAIGAVGGGIVGAATTGRVGGALAGATIGAAGGAIVGGVTAPRPRSSPCPRGVITDSQGNMFCR